MSKFAHLYCLGGVNFHLLDPPYHQKPGPKGLSRMCRLEWLTKPTARPSNHCPPDLKCASDTSDPIDKNTRMIQTKPNGWQLIDWLTDRRRVEMNMLVHLKEIISHFLTKGNNDRWLFCFSEESVWKVVLTFGLAILSFTHVADLCSKLCWV